jgi:hypothetical protein
LEEEKQMAELIYKEIGPEEQELDWRITKAVLSDRTLMKTLSDCQSRGEKHAVVALVESGSLKEAYVSPEPSVKKNFPFGAVEQAFEFYSIEGGVCLVIVRDGKVVASVNGIVGNM